MTQLARERIRIAIDTSKQTPHVDLLTGATPDMWRAKDVQLELALFYGSALVDPMNLASITVSVKPLNDRTGALILPQKTVASGSINAALTKEQWDAGTHQHVIVSWDNVETAVNLGGETEVSYWLIVSALTNDNPGRKIALGHTVLKVVEPGDESASSPAPGDPAYYTAVESDARFGRKLAFVINQANVDSGLVSGLTNPLVINHLKNTKDWVHQVYRVADDTPVDTTLTPDDPDLATLTIGTVPADGEFRFVGFFL